MPPKAPRQVNEETWFEPDPKPLTTAQQKNDRLADLLQGRWNPLAIVEIRRIEIGKPGWEATHRKPPK